MPERPNKAAVTCGHTTVAKNFSKQQTTKRHKISYDRSFDPKFRLLNLILYPIVIPKYAEAELRWGSQLLDAAAFCYQNFWKSSKEKANIAR
ncbi:hypothetical protein [Roseicyclus sp.]|uniref:hypothetical protein n=1 Tax=Roseicyclus sp. TaxID=1914329 RepID=UPI001BCB5E4F|nr:hypothetical protein [Roseicyclus sp.]